MNVKDKIIFGLLIILVAAGGDLRCDRHQSMDLPW